MRDVRQGHAQKHCLRQANPDSAGRGSALLRSCSACHGERRCFIRQRFKDFPAQSKPHGGGCRSCCWPERRANSWRGWCCVGPGHGECELEAAPRVALDAALRPSEAMPAGRVARSEGNDLFAGWGRWHWEGAPLQRPPHGLPVV